MADHHPESSTTDCPAIRTLMLEEASRALGELEARRIERHVEGCDACLEILGGASWDLPPLPSPTAAEWAAVDAAIDATVRTGLEGGIRPVRREPGFRGDGGAESSSRAASWRVGFALPAAAMLAIALLVRLLIPVADLPEAAEELSAVEILEAPDDVNVILQTFGDDTDGAVVMFVSG